MKEDNCGVVAGKSEKRRRKIFQGRSDYAGGVTRRRKRWLRKCTETGPVRMQLISNGRRPTESPTED